MVIAANSIAQASTRDSLRSPVTKLEAFLCKKGSIIVREFNYLNIIVGKSATRIELNALSVYEAGQEDVKLSGIKISVIQSNPTGSINRTSFLDFDEIESLSSALSYMMQTAASWKNVNKEYTEIAYSTKSDFELGFFQKGIKQDAYCASGYSEISRVICFLQSINDFQTIKDAIDKGINLLSTPK